MYITKDIDLLITEVKNKSFAGLILVNEISGIPESIEHIDGLVVGSGDMKASTTSINLQAKLRGNNIDTLIIQSLSSSFNGLGGL